MESVVGGMIKVSRVQIGDKWRLIVDHNTHALIIQYSGDGFATPPVQVVTYPPPPPTEA